MFGSIRNRTMPIITAFCFVILLSMGCASGGGVGGDTPTGPSALMGGKKVGQLSMSIGESLAADAAQVAEDFSIARDLDVGVRKELSDVGFAESGSLNVEVKVIQLKVRSTGSAIWWGALAGADSINVEVSVTENGQSIKSFETGTSTALGGFIYGARGKRITRMLNTLSKRIATGI